MALGLRTALAFGLGLSSQCLVPAARAQDRQDVMPCRVRQGQTTVAVGRMTLSACLRVIYARVDSGTWGPHRIEIEHGGRVRVDDQAFGVLQPHDGSLEDIHRR
jgi:hypothetical protein